MTLTPAQILERLESIERDAADRQTLGEESAENFHRAKRDYEMEYAKAFVQASGTPTERKQAAEGAMEKTQARFDLMAAEGTYEGWKAAMRTLELRATIGQSLLKWQRETGG